MTSLLTLAWHETGGPQVQKPTSRGFGTRSVIASIESQLGGRAEFDWRPEGLICRLSVPLSSPHLRRAGTGSAPKRRSCMEYADRKPSGDALCFRRCIARSADTPLRPRGPADWDETASADIRRRRALGDAETKSSAVIPDIATTGKPGTRSRISPITSRPLVPCRKISTIARSNSAPSNSFNPASALAASTTSK